MTDNKLTLPSINFIIPLLQSEDGSNGSRTYEEPSREISPPTLPSLKDSVLAKSPNGLPPHQLQHPTSFYPQSTPSVPYGLPPMRQVHSGTPSADQVFHHQHLTGEPYRSVTPSLQPLPAPQSPHAASYSSHSSPSNNLAPLASISLTQHHYHPSLMSPKNTVNAEAPVIHLNEQDFAHPLRFLESLKQMAQGYGMVKVVPGWFRGPAEPLQGSHQLTSQRTYPLGPPESMSSTSEEESDYGRVVLGMTPVDMSDSEKLPLAHRDESLIHPIIPEKMFSKRKRRKKHEVTNRIYQCNYKDCSKSYSCLSHLNTHIAQLRHGKRRSGDEFKQKLLEHDRIVQGRHPIDDTAKPMKNPQLLDPRPQQSDDED
ncbi:hypothetical protein BABINDRAFT_159374 [Babjeviella inositovora NRRL Y-12698]|uniref:C2H2-type domain-containing protein n=1 Tax=Babjeviella inositovora NRRL Y-12698 TaxID=984486 RepID=A0A1E3QYW4_9ASCO|nr:uncharacterized protein BABINDRAFT_159374 [Babjeviella inositovora NRRL Y-12698]ODQ82879.1 hypothetical protein BABINDRAFT_159374 [Babjeviella inositovora NRRL Y-12698]